MITQVTLSHSDGSKVKWVDLHDPDQTSLKSLSAEFGIHESSLEDCMEPYHLPKYESHPDYTFIIIRVLDPERKNLTSDITQLTRKVAIFIGKDFIITIHRAKLDFIESLRTSYSATTIQSKIDPKIQVCIEILNLGLNSFDPLIDESIAYINTLEQESKVNLKKIFKLRAQASSVKRLLRLSHDVCVKFSSHLDGSAKTMAQDLRDDVENSLFFAEDLNENILHFINLQLSIQSQRTNETMRIMAIFSAFFMPITFIVGLYGMNFKTMPEIEWTYGYPFSLALMFASTIAVFIWFKKNKWL